MKTIILCCNYNEGKTGNLKRCLETLKRNKLENTIIGLIDNASKDNSLEIINEYIKDKTIDVFIANAKNMGKAKALNSLFKYILITYPIEYEDICLHIDSDIKMHDNFISDSEKCFTKFDDCYLFFTKSSSVENEFVDKHIHMIQDEEYIDVDDEFQKVHRGPGIAGCIWSMKVKSFLEVNMYRENAGKNNNSAIYGGDDGYLVYDLFLKNINKFAYVHKTQYHYHPPCQDEEYQKWKVEQNIIIGKFIKSKDENDFIADKGFYD